MKALLLLLLMIPIFPSCAHTTLWEDGQCVAKFEGDMTGMRYVRHADGSCELYSETIDHSSATLAQGRASSGKIAAAAAIVTAATAAALNQ